MTPHTEHNSSIRPVEGCKECDKEVNRPIQRRHGEGSSGTVVPPRPKPIQEE